MASACSRPLVPAAPGAALTSPACPSKKSTTTVGCRRPRRRSVLCKATGGQQHGDDGGLLWLPRRDVLTGLTGAVAAAGLVGYPGLASGTDDCPKAEQVTDKIVQCTDQRGQIPCPPLSPGSVVNFTPERLVKRVRQPIHRLSREYQEKYKEAVAKMRALPASHPLSFIAQASIHEAYCDGHYKYDPENTSRPFDVHFSWIFAPWHRMYIYFYEKALGELIGDETFALPYWGWDVPAGMVMPALFRDAFANPLHDRNREQAHADKLVDLDYLTSLQSPGGPPPLIPFDGPRDKRFDDAVYNNICTVHQQQIREGKNARAFLGEKFCTKIMDKSQDEKTLAQGSLERMAHTALHVWVGKNGPDGAACTKDAGGILGHGGKYQCNNDMGFLGSSGRDPLFYSHHANVDRLWHLWATKLGGRGFDDPEWLDASFVFYDGVANPKKVRITFRDVLDTAKLGYTYAAEADKDLPWMGCTLTPLVPPGAAAKKPAPPAPAKFPVTLRNGAVVEVPGVAVPAAAKPGQLRELVIEGFDYDPSAENKFDVAINVPKDLAPKIGPQYVEYAGSFAVVPSSKEGGGRLKGKISLCIEDVLADVQPDGVSTVDVVLVPRTNAEIKLNAPPAILVQDK